MFGVSHREERVRAREDKQRHDRQNDSSVGQVQNQGNRQHKKMKGKFPKTDFSTIKKEPTTAKGYPKCG